MSFLGDLMNTIGGDKAPAPPIKPHQRPSNTNLLPSTSSSLPKSAPNTPSVRPVYKGTAGTVAPQQGSSLKRKAEELPSERPVKLSKPTLQNLSDRDVQKPLKSNGGETRSPVTAKPVNGFPPAQGNQNAPKLPAKAPSKGSYADMLARAKEAQSSKAPSQIGVIKHQATEKIKISKLAQRKKEEQDKAKIPAPGQTGKASLSGKVDPRRRSVSPVKKGEQPKIIKEAKPPLHGPPRPAAPAYKGTMNQAPKKSREEVKSKKSSRYDDYLGTDEEEDEDDDGYGYGQEEDYYSDDLSDMEGGFDDVEAEEQAALKAAKADDARELALEAKLKKEKEDRKKKLVAMAAKRK